MFNKFLKKKETETTLWVIFYLYYSALILLTLIGYEGQDVINIFLIMCILPLWLIVKRYTLLKGAAEEGGK